MDVIWKVLLAQIVVMGVICVVLCMMLEKELWKVATELLAQLNIDDAQKPEAIVVKTANKLEFDRREKVLQLVQSKHPDMNVTFTEDASLRGGVLIQINEQHFDFTVAARLKALWS